MSPFLIEDIKRLIKSEIQLSEKDSRGATTRDILISMIDDENRDSIVEKLNGGCHWCTRQVVSFIQLVDHGNFLQDIKIFYEIQKEELKDIDYFIAVNRLIKAEIQDGRERQNIKAKNK